jgi:GNAT superfamily N-acetyltransferase
MASLEKRIAAVLLGAIRAHKEQPTSGQNDAASRSEGGRGVAKLREARFSDFQAVADLKERWGLGADSIENWERLWRRNPASVHSPSDRPIGWVLEADREVVGYIGNIALQCRYGDRVLTAVTPHGLVVEPSYRGIGVSLNAAFFRQKGVDLYLCTTAIPAVGQISKALKADPVPQPDYETVLFWVLQPQPFVKAVLRKLGIKSSLSGACSALASLVLLADTSLRRRWPRVSETGVSVTEIGVDELGVDFETLWMEKAKERPRLLGERNLETMRWHFAMPGSHDTTRVLGCYRNDKLTGYAVIRDDEPDESGLRKSLIADLLALKDDNAAIGALLAAAHSHARRAGSHILEVMGFPESVRRAFGQARPYQRKYPACPYYYKAADPVLHKTLADAEAWYACPFDGDASLIRPSYPDPRMNVPPKEEYAGTQTVVAVGVSEGK